MTATATPEPPASVGPRPVPWPSLAWVTLRQRRTAIIGVSALLGVIAVYLLVMAIIQNNAYAAVTACHPATSIRCSQLAQAFSADYWGGHSSALASGGAQTVSSLMFAVPVLVGAFIGAPLISRELESGTFRFAWTQGAGRTRWALSTLVLPALLLATVMGALTAMFSWYLHPFLADGQVSEFLPLAFGTLGVAFAAWALFAYALAAFLGALLRRLVPTMAVTLIAYIVLAIVTATSIRPYYAAPVAEASWNRPAGAGWVISSWVDAPDGQRVSQSALNTLAASAQGPETFTGWLTQHGYTMWQSVQPDSRFWQFQLTEGGWLLGTSALLIGASIWLIRRRGA